MQKELLIKDTLIGIGESELSFHLAHILCFQGQCHIRFNGIDVTISPQNCCIIRATQLIESVHTSDDFKVKVIYASPAFIEKSTPNSNYGMRGSLSLSQNPVMLLNDEEFQRCKRGFEQVEQRLLASDHRFYGEMLYSVMRTLILDFFDFHLRINGPYENPTSQGAYIMGKFIGLLERGEYRRIREVRYYAEQLCVTAKHLSEISRAITGFAANWWINRFTILDISRQLKDRSQTITDIAESFHFASISYFSRYVQRHLGESPTSFRDGRTAK